MGIRIGTIILLFNSCSSFKQSSREPNISWLVGNWKCKFQNSKSEAGKLSRNTSSGEFDVKKDFAGQWLSGVFSNNNITTKSFYLDTEDTSIMYFIDSLGGHGKGQASSNLHSPNIEYKGTSYFQKYQSSFLKNFKKISQNEYHVFYEVRNPEYEYWTKSSGKCVRE